MASYLLFFRMAIFSPIIGSEVLLVSDSIPVGKGTQYGWARIKTARDADYRVHDEIKDYAWGDVGDAILTGQKQSLQPANANSVPGSLGLLAFGAQGLDAWRTQRTQNSTD